MVFPPAIGYRTMEGDEKIQRYPVYGTRFLTRIRQTYASMCATYSLYRRNNRFKIHEKSHVLYVYRKRLKTFCEVGSKFYVGKIRFVRSSRVVRENRICTEEQIQSIAVWYQFICYTSFQTMNHTSSHVEINDTQHIHTTHDGIIVCSIRWALDQWRI